ncbi:MAG: metallophosphoesterase [Acidimicrobiales bacterium]|nr:metallophosphoesterase [Acidimicrobiales bacterium]MCB9392213.1 metallophosphoesterase [Acidimicrobiaceae bacterium]
MSERFDVIGDVHGSVAVLEGLLGKLGYRRTGDGPWEHPDRRAVFVGDLVDRGPGQRRTIELVRAMVEAGTAFAALGNHEFNAIGYATRRAGGEGHLRERNRKHFGQHQQFLLEYPVDGDDHADVIDWFRTLPLWLELPGLRVVHACWSDEHIELLRAEHDGPYLPTGAHLERLFTKDHPLYEAIDVVLKGPEVLLPDHLHYRDKDGQLREKARLMWWTVSHRPTLRDSAVFIPGSTDADGNPHPGFDDTPIPASAVRPYRDQVPVVVGHYWFDGSLRTLSPSAVCVDYSAVRHGQLVAYRFDGETSLSHEKMIAFP